MKFKLPEWKFAPGSLEPFMSNETVEFHYGRHHKNYVDTVNRLLVAMPVSNPDLIEIIRTSNGAMYENAGQAWNHTFFWECLTNQKAELDNKSNLYNKIVQSFGSLNNFKAVFIADAAKLFGSGWTWLVKDKSQRLRIINTRNGDNPIREGHFPLLVCDVWEHAYYIDFRNERKKYLEHYFDVVNWEYASQLFDSDKLPDVQKLMIDADEADRSRGEDKFPPMWQNSPQ